MKSLNVPQLIFQFFINCDGPNEDDTENLFNGVKSERDPCCTNLKVAATWGAAIHVLTGVMLLLRYFFVHEILGQYRLFYLGYIGVFILFGVVILFAAIKEITWIIKIGTGIFLTVQVYGLIIRILIPVEEHQLYTRISTLFMSIVITLIYAFILILYIRKLKPELNIDSTEPQSSTEV